MKNIEDLISALEEKYGAINALILCNSDYCDTFFYDKGCESCKGNATGN